MFENRTRNLRIRARNLLGAGFAFSLLAVVAHHACGTEESAPKQHQDPSAQTGQLTAYIPVQAELEPEPGAAPDQEEQGEPQPTPEPAPVPAPRPPPPSDGSSGMNCFVRAHRDFQLADQTAMTLCLGATSDGPAQCYKAARDRTGLVGSGRSWGYAAARARPSPWPASSKAPARSCSPTTA